MQHVLREGLFGFGLCVVVCFLEGREGLFGLGCVCGEGEGLVFAMDCGGGQCGFGLACVHVCGCGGHCESVSLVASHQPTIPSPPPPPHTPRIQTQNTQKALTSSSVYSASPVAWISAPSLGTGCPTGAHAASPGV